MVETFYAHIEFTDKNGKSLWSINLPFLCSHCGVCCTLENFLTAGKINDPEITRPEVYSKFKNITEDLGKIWEKDESKYERHIESAPCPFIKNNCCTIYEIRPTGCKLYPNTKFGIASPDCEALQRFKKQKGALKKGRTCKETCSSLTMEKKFADQIKPVKCSDKQFEMGIAKLQRVGITVDELSLFFCLNKRIL